MSYTRLAVSLAAASILVPAAHGQARAVKPKANVELRWLESEQVKGLTEDWGVTIMCGPVKAYPHKQAVLSHKDVAEARMCKVDLSSSGLPSEQYMVSFRLTEAARTKLVAECGDEAERMITVLVDGKAWGMRIFRKGEAKEFEPQVGFISSRSEAERIVEAFK